MAKTEVHGWRVDPEIKVVAESEAQQGMARRGFDRIGQWLDPRTRLRGRWAPSPTWTRARSLLTWIEMTAGLRWVLRLVSSAFTDIRGYADRAFSLGPWQFSRGGSRPGILFAAGF